MLFQEMSFFRRNEEFKEEILESAYRKYEEDGERGISGNR